MLRDQNSFVLLPYAISGLMLFAPGPFYSDLSVSSVHYHSRVLFLISRRKDVEVCAVCFELRYTVYWEEKRLIQVEHIRRTNVSTQSLDEDTSLMERRKVMECDVC